MKYNVIDVDASNLQEKYQIGLLSAKLLMASHLSDEEIHELFNTDTALTTSKAECIQKCCKRLLQARDNHEKVMIAGDYDADGICSTTIMKMTLMKLKIEHGYYIPDRMKEGYGLSAHTVELAHQKGYSLIITVDNGVKAHAAIQKANELGLDIIITDHHQIDEEIETPYVVHPNYMESEYCYLSGAGVALQIARNLIGDNDIQTAFACVAAIADVMPLWKETRRIVKRGLDVLKQGRPRSLISLLNPGSGIDMTSISFSIVPKLNSLGRMSDLANVNTMIPFLLSNNEEQIAHYAAQVNQINEKRKEISSSISEMAINMIADEKFPILYQEDFHEGVSGLVAGRIVSQLHRPVLVMAKSHETIKGSGRSVPGFNLFDFFKDFENLAAFGGHEQAVGISVPIEKFEEFYQQAQEKMAKTGYEYIEPVQDAIRIDVEDINFNNIIDIDCFTPYPKEMIEPNFALEGMNVVERKETAKMVKYLIANSSGGFEAVLYKSRNLTAPILPKRLIGKLSINRWRNRTTCQMILEDIV